MTESRKHTAHINRKGLDATGVTEDHARAMASHLGGHTMLIVEARHHAVLTDAEGKQSVVLVLTNVEPVPAHLEDRVRDFQRALYRQRPDQEGQAVLRGTADETSPDDAAAGLDAVVERDAEGNVTGVWDGDMDAPLAAVPDTTDEDDDPCAFPGCILPQGHDGDHDNGS